MVINGTTGKPQPGVVDQLVQPRRSGMQTIGSVKTDAEGKFKIDKAYPPGPVLLQAIYAGRDIQPDAAAGHAHHRLQREGLRFDHEPGIAARSRST